MDRSGRSLIGQRYGSLCVWCGVIACVCVWCDIGLVCVLCHYVRVCGFSVCVVSLVLGTQ